MKSSKINEYKNMSVEQLQKELKELAAVNLWDIPLTLHI